MLKQSNRLISAPEIEWNYYVMCYCVVANESPKYKKQTWWERFKKTPKEEIPSKLPELSKDDVFSTIIEKIVGSWESEYGILRIDPFEKVDGGFYTTLKFNNFITPFWYFPEEMVVIMKYREKTFHQLLSELQKKLDTIYPHTAIGLAIPPREPRWEWMESWDKITLLVYSSSPLGIYSHESDKGVDISRLNYHDSILWEAEGMLDGEFIRLKEQKMAYGKDDIKPNAMKNVMDKTFFRYMRTKKRKKLSSEDDEEW